MGRQAARQAGEESAALVGGAIATTQARTAGPHPAAADTHAHTIQHAKYSAKTVTRGPHPTAAWAEGCRGDPPFQRTMKTMVTPPRVPMFAARRWGVSAWSAWCAVGASVCVVEWSLHRRVALQGVAPGAHGFEKCPDRACQSRWVSRLFLGSRCVCVCTTQFARCVCVCARVRKNCTYHFTLVAACGGGCSSDLARLRLLAGAGAGSRSGTTATAVPPSAASGGSGGSSGSGGAGFSVGGASSSAGGGASSGTGSSASSGGGAAAAPEQCPLDRDQLGVVSWSLVRVHVAQTSPRVCSCACV